MNTKTLAVVRVRGKVNLNQEIVDTFEYLHLYNKNWCVFVENTKPNLGMITKVKDYVTWGEISPEVLSDMMTKRGELQKNQDKPFFEYNKKKYNKFVRLSPPKKGYGRKGVKVGFSKGGALGYRGEKINDLLKRMI